ncbi:DUF1330 domain-containing protein [Bradyrhizobium diazoefficiens]|nr:DUF1330 domain-containing protein [Bradyrhizobium diazoefficiens]MBR0810093.1 DUF1330 domain-containing protein [Bradyrhizobium diazoefficiens]
MRGFVVACAVAAGIAIGALGSHEIHAQATRPVFMIEDNTVRNPDGFAKEFAPLARDSVKAYGGRYLAGGGGISIDGDPPKGRVVLIEWDSIEQLTKWRQSPEYTQARAVGEKYGSFRIIAVEGAAK